MSANRSLSVVCVCAISLGLSAAFTEPAWAKGPPDEETAIKVAKKFIKLVMKGDTEEANEFLGEAWAREMREHKDDYWKELNEKAKGLQSFGEATTEVFGDRVLVTLPVKFTNGALTLKVLVNGDEEIDMLKYDAHMLLDKEGKALTLDQPMEVGEKEVTFGKEPWTVQGKLTLPSAQKPVPAVILVHGTGARDGDQSIGACKPFADLAQGLGGQGIAVLRFPNRAAAHKDELSKQKTVTIRDELIEDVVAALKFVRSQKGINKSKVYLLGIGFGGTVATEVAKEDKAVAGVILLGSSPRNIADYLETQLTYLAALPGKQGQNNAKMLNDSRGLLGKLRDGSAPGEAVLLGQPVPRWKEMSELSTGSLKTLAELECRVFIAGAGRDYQAIRADYDEYKNALKDRPKVKFKWYKSLNHYFVRGEGKSSPEEYEKPGSMDPKVIGQLGAWIKGG
jgi:dienelactone hydrolase